MITSENIHFWNSDNPFKEVYLMQVHDKLLYFANTDDAINWLYLNNHKLSAREIHNKYKIN